jgi:dipeptidase E
MTGTIYLGGGGDATDEESLWRAMLRHHRRVLYWPFALPPERVRGAEEWLASSLSDLQLDVELETWTGLEDHHPDELTRMDLLFVGGGNTFQLLHHVRRHRFGPAVRNFVARGGGYYGGSAGAILASSEIRVAVGVDENEVGLTDLTGLGLVRDFDTLPHYDDGQEMAAQEWSSNHERVLLGVPERSGLAIRDGCAEVVGHVAVSEFNGSVLTVRRPGERWIVSSS